MLKYFNKLIFLLKKNFNYNITNIIENYSIYIYSSFLLNLSIPNYNNVSLVSINNYFMQKSNKSYSTGWLINDRIFNYIDTYDIISKKKMYWNTIIPVSILAKRNIEKSYFMIPEVSQNYDLKYAYFFGKNFRLDYLNYYRNYVYLFFFFFVYVVFRNYFKQGFFFNYIQKLSKFSRNSTKFFFNSFFIFKLQYLFFYLNLNNKILIKKNHILNSLKEKIFNLKQKQKKILLLKFLIFFILLNLNQRYLSLIKSLDYPILNIINKYFKNFYKSKSFDYRLYNTLLTQYKHVFGPILKLNSKNFIFKKTFLNIRDNYYTTYSEKNQHNTKKCILHLVEKKTNNFLVLSLFNDRRVIGHTSAGQGMYRAYSNSKRQKKGTRILGKILFRKFKLRVRKYGLKEVFLKYNYYWNFRINFLTKYWVLRYKLGIRKLRGLKLGLGLPYHKGLRIPKRKRK